MLNSMENAFSGTVTEVIASAYFQKLRIERSKGDPIISRVLNSQADDLGVGFGSPVRLFIDPHNIFLAIASSIYGPLSAVNQLPGTVSSIVNGTHYDRVQVALAGNDTIWGMTPHGYLNDVGMGIGDHVYACFNAANVVVGVA